MNHYNIAVTVGPNIFRAKEISVADLVNGGIYYDVMIKLMQNFDYIFEENKEESNEFFSNIDRMSRQDDGDVRQRERQGMSAARGRGAFDAPP